VASMLRLGFTDGTIRQCDVTEVSRTIFAAFNGVARRGPGHSEEAPDKIADKILDIFFTGLTPRKSTAMASAGRAAGKPSARSRAR